ncbi:MAG: recombinase family protein [Proteobacteria bacterium]|nr:recombinase family protein [Pseudomonadota bacterium]
MRAVIYARYSSDNQREASIVDQLRICRAHIEQQGWEYLTAYTDHAVSGASTLRPGYQKLLEDARAGSFEVVVAEALDRLSRDQADVASLYKHLSFLGIKIVTLAEGEITELHIGLKGTMNALFLKDLAQKTRRGLEGRVRQGKSAGGRAYGYDIVREYDAAGEPIRGQRRINENEAKVVCLIFSDYASGRSSRAIAKSLNERRVPGPKGKPWSDYTIHGNRRRGTGILNNELYRGRLVWNRQRFVKDPTTGRRQARLNPTREWLTHEVPSLRIIDDDLWHRAKARQMDLCFEDGEKTKGGKLNRRHRSQYLLSGLIKCGSCKSNFIIVGKDKYGCATRRTKGTCSNSHVLKRQDIETLVLDGLKEKLIEPKLVEAFIKEFNAEIARQGAERQTDRRHDEAKLRDVEKRIEAIVFAIEQGVLTETTRDRLLHLESQKKTLKAGLAKLTPAPYPALHPNLVGLYKRKVAALEEALADPEIRSEAGEILRGLVDRIEVTPAPDTTGNSGGDDPVPDAESSTQSSGVAVILYGELAAVIGLAEENETIENKQGFSLSAGARNHRELTLQVPV